MSGFSRSSALSGELSTVRRLCGPVGHLAPVMDQEPQVSAEIENRRSGAEPESWGIGLCSAICPSGSAKGRSEDYQHYRSGGFHADRSGTQARSAQL
jgi:hypothetical protein